MSDQEFAEQFIADVVERLPEQNRTDSQKVAFLNLTTGSVGIMNNNHFPMPGQDVVFFGGCRSEDQVRSRINNYLNNEQ